MPILTEIKNPKCFCGEETHLKGKYSTAQSRITKYIYLCPAGHRTTKNHAYKDAPVTCPVCFRQCVNELDIEAIEIGGMCPRCDNQRSDF